MSVSKAVLLSPLRLNPYAREILGPQTLCLELPVRCSFMEGKEEKHVHTVEVVSQTGVENEYLAEDTLGALGDPLGYMFFFNVCKRKSEALDEKTSWRHIGEENSLTYRQLVEGNKHGIMFDVGENLAEFQTDSELSIETKGLLARLTKDVADLANAFSTLPKFPQFPVGMQGVSMKGMRLYCPEDQLDFENMTRAFRAYVDTYTPWKGAELFWKPLRNQCEIMQACRAIR